MNLIPPTNWDNELIPTYNALGVKEVYGKLVIDEVGGGRPAYILPNVSKKDASEHIRLLHEAGIRFNYVLNAPCMSSQEFTRSGRARINKLLTWLVQAGVDKVTVTIPYLLQIIKEKYPKLEVSVSVFAGVDTVEKALFWQAIGADEITLLQTTMNRDFKRLKLIRKKVKCKLRLIGNTGCLYDCPLIGYHALTSSFASQKMNSTKAGLNIEYCSLFCRYMRLNDPVKFIKSNWIRPEDLHLYEAIGINGIKLVDRKCSTEQLIKIVESYAKRRFDGNLIDLLPMFSGRQPLAKQNLLLKAKYFFHPFESNILALPRLNRLVQDLDIYIDNRKLDCFINKFIKQDCKTIACSDCRYCDRIAKKVVQYDKKYLNRLKDAHKEFLQDLIKGNV